MHLYLYICVYLMNQPIGQICIVFANNQNQESWRLMVKEYIADIRKPFSFLFFFPIFALKNMCFRSVQTSLLCIVGELGWLGSWLLLLGKGPEKWHLSTKKGIRWQVTNYMSKTCLVCCHFGVGAILSMSRDSVSPV